MRPTAQVLAVGDFFQLPPVELARTDFAFNSWWASLLQNSA